MRHNQLILRLILLSAVVFLPAVLIFILYSGHVTNNNSQASIPTIINKHTDTRDMPDADINTAITVTSCISILKDHPIRECDSELQKHIVQLITKTWDNNEETGRHRILLAAADWAGLNNLELLDTVLQKAANDSDVMISRDALLILAVAEHMDRRIVPRKNLPKPAHDAWLTAAARSGTLIQTDEQSCPKDLSAYLQYLSSAKPEISAILPKQKDSIEERAFWLVPRWQIALETESVGDEHIALGLLQNSDNHVRQAGLLASGLLKLAEDRINQSLKSDDDISCRHYALLAKLMLTEAEDPEYGTLVSRVIEMGDRKSVQPDDALFALLASGASEGMDWLLDPLRPRRSFDESPLNRNTGTYGSDETAPEPSSIWPILKRFFGNHLDIPPNTGSSKRVIRLHADLLRMWWLLHRHDKQIFQA